MSLSTPFTRALVRRKRREDSGQGGTSNRGDKALRPRRLPNWRSVRGPLSVGLVAGIAGGLALAHVHYQQIDVLAAVNGKLITLAELDRRLENAGGQSMMRQMATEETQLQFAKSEGALPTEKCMDTKMAELRKSPSFAQILVNLGETEDDYRQNLLIHVAQANLLSRGLKITRSDIEQFYRKNVDRRNPSAQFYQPETATISVIVAADPKTATAAQHALTIGTPFPEVAARYSVDNSRANGGSIPTIRRGRTNSARIPGLEDFIFSLKVGELSDIHRFGNMYWIIRCADRTPSKTLGFDQVQEDCDIGVRMAKGLAANGATVQAKFESFQRTSRVQSFSQQYQTAINAR